MAVRHHDEVLPTKHDVIAEASFAVKKFFLEPEKRGGVLTEANNRRRGLRTVFD
jgi:hypothetical protein